MGAAATGRGAGDDDDDVFGVWRGLLGRAQASAHVLVGLGWATLGSFAA